MAWILKKVCGLIVEFENKMKALPDDPDDDVAEMAMCQFHEELDAIMEDFHDYIGNHNPEELWAMPGFGKCLDETVRIFL